VTTIKSSLTSSACDWRLIAVVAEGLSTFQQIVAVHKATRPLKFVYTNGTNVSV